MAEEGVLSSEEVRAFLEGLKERTDIDFTGYAVSSAARRLKRIRKQYGIYSYDTLIEKLSTEPLLKLDFVERFTVNVTEMFRDPVFFQEMTKILQEYIEDHSEDLPITFWHPGCSSGEEILSMAICMHLKGLANACRFVGSDINEKVLERATRKLIRTRHLSDYEKAYQMATGEANLASHFESINGDESILNDHIPVHSKFYVKNLVDLSWPGKGPFDVVMCRNVMIYFTPLLQDRVFSFLISKLKVGGILALGHKESIVFCSESNRLEPLNGDARIFRKVR